jgi:hypothetical protein
MYFKSAVNGGVPYLCSSFKLDPVWMRKTTYLVTERPQSYLKASKIIYGWCCPYDYWLKHMEGNNNIHVLIGKRSVADFTTIIPAELDSNDRLSKGLRTFLYSE